MRLNQTRTMKCLYWAQPTDNPDNQDKYGEFIHQTPRLIPCRWQLKVTEMVDDGINVVSTAMVWVEEDLDVGGFLLLDGDENTADPDPAKNEDSRRIMAFRKTPTLRGDSYERVGFLE